VRLFADRAAAARPSFVVDATNVTAVGEICRRLDGIPLAVELAAARVRSMSPDEIAELLDERFRLLTGGRRRGVERHQTLRAAVEWSYALLDERDRSVFDRLGVFAGSFDTDAATSVAGSDELTAWDVRDALDGLAAKSMVVLEDGADGGTRFRLHETMRQYALERLDETGEAEEFRRRHAQYYATFAEKAGPGLEGPDEVVWAARFDAELDNLRAAVAWALEADAADDGELGLRIIAVLGFQQFFRRSAGVGQWAEAALGRSETSTPGRRTAVLATAAWSAYHEGDIALMRARAAEALREGLPPDTRSPGSVYSALVAAEAVSGDHEAALQTAAAGQRALDAIGADEFAHIVADAPGLVARLLAGQYEDARAFVAELLKRARALANPSALNIALLYYGWTRRLDESDEAIPALEECLTRSRAVATPDGTFVLRALALLAKHRARRGERTPAIELLREAVVRAHDSGQALTVGFVVNHGVTVAADLGAWELAATLGAALSDGSLSGLTVLVHPADHTDRQAALDRTREDLDVARYTTAVASGTNMPYEEIIQYTLTTLDRLRADV
jgi:tetratricopeptide (TPR) repeat protein